LGERELSEKEATDTLKGAARDIYRFMLKANKPLGVRELTRALKLSSPSVAQHHLTRLESLGLVKREWGNYVVNRVMLENCIKISRFLIPRYFFYLLFVVVVLVLELTILQPNVLYQAYVLSILASIVVIAIFCYETIKIWRKGSL
jgi:DNA-binding transcriptional ArsR family regulator